MQKLNVGGAAHSDPEKGITLIALIITIIVMLILVGVTINVALNGGLFEKAKNAKEQTQVETNKELLLSAVVSAMKTDGSIDYLKLKQEAEKVGFARVSDLVYTKDGYTYTVDELTGLITARKTEASGENGGNQTQNSSDLEEYILGNGGEGRELFGTNGIWDMATMIFGQDPEDPTSTVYNDVKFSHMDETTGDIYIRYGRDVYKFGMTMTGESQSDMKYYSAKNSLTKVSTPTGNLGKYVTYSGKPWIVLSEDSNEVELIRADAIGSVTLGGDTFENARASYNGAYATLTNACKTGLPSGANVRNVGGPATDPALTEENLEANPEIYRNYVKFSELSKFQPNSNADFSEHEGIEKGLLIGNNDYLTDYDQMKKIGILATDTPTTYWLASRFVDGSSDRVDFRIRFVDGYGILGNYYLCNVDSNAHANSTSADSYAVRPVVSITLSSSQKTALDNSEGTRANPFQI